MHSCGAAVLDVAYDPVGGRVVSLGADAGLIVSSIADGRVLARAKVNAEARRIGFSPMDAIEGELEARPRQTPMFLPLALITAALSASR